MTTTLPALQVWPNLKPWLEKEVIEWVDLHFAYFTLTPFFSKNESLESSALFLSYLFSASRKGNLCIKIVENSIFPKLGDSSLSEKILEGISSLPKELMQKVSSFERSPTKLICQYRNAFYLQKYWVYETQIYHHLDRLSKNNSLSFSKLSDQLNENQKKAIKHCYQSSITFLLGGPGTGKTFTAGHLISSYRNNYPDHKIAIAAPTGKAAFELAKKLPGIGKTFTLHSLLNVHPNSRIDFQGSPLDYDLYIIDEASMIDVKMMALLLSKIKTNAKLVFLGDPNQLPSVEAGSLFSDLSKSFPLFCVTLQKAVRFENEALYNFSQAVLQKDKATLKRLLHTPSIQLKSWKFTAQLPDPFLQYVKRLYITKENDPLALLQKQQCFRILSPLRKGPFGIEQINKQLFSFLELQAPFSTYFTYPIMISQNREEQKLFNGMIGIVREKKWSSDDRKAYFPVQDQVKEFSYASLPRHELAYAISVHKSQGSEYDSVLLVIPPESKMTSKELFYTAATRAKKELLIWGNEPQILDSLDNSINRISGRQEIT